MPNASMTSDKNHNYYIFIKLHVIYNSIVHVVLLHPESQSTKKKVSEKVNDFIRRIKKTFRRAYGHDLMLSETRDALLYAQLQEDLKYELMKALSVSGALSYQALCIVSKSEERRLAELQKRKQYQSPQPEQATSQPQVSFSGSQFEPGQRSGRSSGASQSK